MKVFGGPTCDGFGFCTKTAAFSGSATTTGTQPEDFSFLLKGRRRTATRTFSISPALYTFYTTKYNINSKNRVNKTNYIHRSTYHGVWF